MQFRCRVLLFRLFFWLFLTDPFTTALGCVHKGAPGPTPTGQVHTRTQGAYWAPSHFILLRYTRAWARHNTWEQICQTHPPVHTRPSLVVLPPPRHCSLLGGRHLKPRPRDRHPPANGSTPSLPFSYSSKCLLVLGFFKLNGISQDGIPLGQNCAM